MSDVHEKKLIISIPWSKAMGIRKVLRNSIHVQIYSPDIKHGNILVGSRIHLM
jgi:hypothetical protein